MMISKTALFCSLIGTMPSAFYCSLIPLKIGNFRRPMSENDLGRGFKLNVAQSEDSFKKKVLDGDLEIQPMTESKTISTVIKDYDSLEESMEIGGGLAVSYGPTISGEGSGNYLEKSISSTRKVTVVYRSRHTAFFKRLEPGTLTPTQDAQDLVTQPQELTNTFGTRFIDTIIYGAQLDVSFTVTSVESLDITDIEASLKGSIGTGALDIDFAAKFETQEGQERATYSMEIAAEASGVQVTIPANPSFEQVVDIINRFNEEYEEKFKNFEVDNNPLLERIEPVGFLLSSTADRIGALKRIETDALEDKMNDLGKVFSETMYWKAKLSIINRGLKTRYESNHKLRNEMYNPYILQQEVVMKSLNAKRDECLAFRSLSMSDLIAPNTSIPDPYPKVGSKEEDVLRGLSGEHYIPDPVKIGNYTPLQGMYYIGFALKDGNKLLPWMDGSLKLTSDDSLLAKAETPQNLYDKVARTLPPTPTPTATPTYSEEINYDDIIYLQVNSRDHRWLSGGRSSENKMVITRDIKGSDYESRNYESYRWKIQSSPTNSGSDTKSGTCLKYGDIIYLRVNHRNNRWLTGARGGNGNSKVQTNNIDSTEHEKKVTTSYEWIVKSHPGETGHNTSQDRASGICVRDLSTIYLQNHFMNSRWLSGGRGGSKVPNEVVKTRNLYDSDNNGYEKRVALTTYQWIVRKDLNHNGGGRNDGVNKCLAFNGKGQWEMMGYTNENKESKFKLAVPTISDITEQESFCFW